MEAWATRVAHRVLKLGFCWLAIAGRGPSFAFCVRSVEAEYKKCLDDCDIKYGHRKRPMW
jgi:shikimate kinase